MNAFATPSNRSSYSGLGACWIVYGLLRLVIAVCLVMYARVATVMFGALLVQVADYIPAMEIFHACYIFAIILSVLCGIFGVLGGVALVRQRTSQLAVIAAFLSLSELPIGITLGIYTLLTIFRARRAE
jgi:predicted small integral membrane protein